MTSPSHEQIAHRSYLIWQQEGMPIGSDLDHWLRAEQELNSLFNPEPKQPFQTPQKKRAVKAQKAVSGPPRTGNQPTRKKKTGTKTRNQPASPK